jgi:hypothetical protein
LKERAVVAAGLKAVGLEGIRDVPSGQLDAGSADGPTAHLIARQETNVICNRCLAGRDLPPCRLDPHRKKENTQEKQGHSDIEVLSR